MHLKNATKTIDLIVSLIFFTIKIITNLQLKVNLLATLQTAFLMDNKAKI